MIESIERADPPTDVVRRHLALMSSVGSSPPFAGNKVTLFTSGGEAYAAIFESILAAGDHINMESFSIDHDRIGADLMDALLRKRGDGVDVNLIYDSMGCFETPGSYFLRLEEAGVQTVEFSPVNPLKAGCSWDLNHRNHRKVLIVDGATAFTGSVNYGKIHAKRKGRRKRVDPLKVWEDTHIRIDGPAAAEFQRLFIDAWARGDGPKLPRRKYFPLLKEEGNEVVQVLGNKPGEKNRVTYMAYLSAIMHASNFVYLHTPYFVPDDQLRGVLCDTAKRGVDVRVLVPWKSDWDISLHAGRIHYEELLRAGVKLYQSRGPMPHGKYAIVDGVWSTVGTSNLNMRSLLDDDEIDAVIFGPEFAGKLAAVFERDIEDADRVILEEWRGRSTPQRLKEWFAHLIERWL